jgi:outer membrane protein assembly factor BamB
MFFSPPRRTVFAGLGSLLSIALASLPIVASSAAQSAGNDRVSGHKVAALRNGLWRPDGTVLVVAAHGKRIYVAGDFTHMVSADGQVQKHRVRIAALNRKTGALIKSFHPRINGTVRSLAVFNHRLFVGGYFTKVDGRSRHHLAAVRLSDGHLVAPWHDQVDGPVFSLLHLGDRLYVGGDFRHVGEAQRTRLFALDHSLTAVQGWPTGLRGANGPVFALAKGPDHRSVVVGGHFLDLLGHSRVNLGAINPRGHLTRWKPAAVCSSDCPVRDLAVGPTRVYAGIDGPGGRARAYRWATGKTAWSVKTNGDVDAVDHSMFAELDAATGALGSRSPHTSGATFPGILAMHVSHGVALLGGAFDTIAGQGRLAVIAP